MKKRNRTIIFGLLLSGGGTRCQDGHGGPTPQLLKQMDPTNSKMTEAIAEWNRKARAKKGTQT